MAYTLNLSSKLQSNSVDGQTSLVDNQPGLVLQTNQFFSTTFTLSQGDVYDATNFLKDGDTGSILPLRLLILKSSAPVQVSFGSQQITTNSAVTQTIAFRLAREGLTTQTRALVTDLAILPSTADVLLPPLSPLVANLDAEVVFRKNQITEANTLIASLTENLNEVNQALVDLENADNLELYNEKLSKNAALLDLKAGYDDAIEGFFNDYVDDVNAVRIAKENLRVQLIAQRTALYQQLQGAFDAITANLDIVPDSDYLPLVTATDPGSDSPPFESVDGTLPTPTIILPDPPEILEPETVPDPELVTNEPFPITPLPLVDPEPTVPIVIRTTVDRYSDLNYTRLTEVFDRSEGASIPAQIKIKAVTTNSNPGAAPVPIQVSLILAFD